MEDVGRLQEVVKKLPQSTDEDEVRIVRLIQQELLATEWAKEAFGEARELLLQYFRRSVDNLDHPEEIHDDTQAVLKDVASTLKTKIVSGEEHLDQITKKSPVIAVVNHLGTYKLTEIKPAELELGLPVDVIHPFPIYYASLVPIGEVLGDDLYETHVELPEPLHQVQKAAGLIIVPPDQGVLFNLQRQVSELVNNHPNSLITVFPEGGTSGKRNGGGPYDLEEFKTGAFVIAANLSIPILPVGQYFNPDSGFEVGILPVINVEKSSDRSYYENLASNTQKAMQEWLNSRK